MLQRDTWGDLTAPDPTEYPLVASDRPSVPSDAPLVADDVDRDYLALVGWGLFTLALVALVALATLPVPLFR